MHSFGVSRIHRKQEQDGNGNRNDPVENACDVIIQIKFYSVILLDNVVGPFCTVLPKQVKPSNL